MHSTFHYGLHPQSLSLHRWRLKFTDYSVPKDTILFIRQTTERKLNFLQITTKLYWKIQIWKRRQSQILAVLIIKMAPDETDTPPYTHLRVHNIKFCFETIQVFHKFGPGGGAEFNSIQRIRINSLRNFSDEGSTATHPKGRSFPSTSTQTIRPLFKR